MVYRVLADGIDIFGSDTESSLLSPSLELELNSAGSLEFTLPPDHPSYDDISLMQTEIDVYEDEDLIFFGRPAEVGIDWNKQKKVVCEGALAYLNDAAIRPHKFEGALISDVFKYIIAQYNAQVAQNKQFIVGNITITDRYVYTEFDYDICLSVLISTCIDSTGGYLFLRKEENGIYIDWLDEVPDVSDQPVQFASNMLDLNQDTRAEDICTVVLPVGGQVDGVNITIASVNEGSDILEDSDAIAKYGRILKIQQWNDIIDPQALKDKATEWLEKQQEDDITIETDAAELHYLDGSVGAYRIGQLVNVISGPHGVDKEYPILKMSMSLDSGTKKITLGTPPRKELTELSGITNSTGSSSSSGGGGGGGSSDGVRDVLVNGSSVVSDHVARISAVTAQQLADGLATKADEDDFEVLQVAVAGKASQADLNALNTTVAGKASQADLNALSTTVSGKQDQLTPGTGISIDANNVISTTGGGGTEVEANPSEAATDDLNTIKIGETVYDIPGGGGSGLSDYYSTEERVVGRWTDGKPLYQKTINCGSISRTGTTTISHNIDNLERAVTIIGNCINNSGVMFPIPLVQSGDIISYQIRVSINNTSISLSTVSVTDISSCYVTIQYTKTTDAPGTGPTKGNLIYLPALYSEEEREVGVWKDGKPLYQKTVVIDNPICDGAIHNYAHDISNADVIYNISGTLGNAVNINTYNGSNYYSTVYSSRSNITYEIKWGSGSFDILVVTIQYTKTTDQPGSGTWTPEGQLAHHYSTSERIVGTWIDGSTIYERTWDFGSNIQIPKNTWYHTSIDSTNMDRLVDVVGYADEGAKWAISGGCDGNTVELIQFRNNNIAVRYLTLQYTKSS